MIHKEEVIVASTQVAKTSKARKFVTGRKVTAPAAKKASGVRALTRVKTSASINFAREVRR